MNVTFDLSIVQGNVLQITDTTQEYYEYLEEDNNNYVRLGRFKYSDTKTVNVIKYNPYNAEQPTILDIIVTDHILEGELAHLDEAHYPLQKDGYYIIDHIVLPTLDWLKNHINDEIIKEYSGIYVIDGEAIYKLIGESLEECNIEELIALENPDITTISKASQETFSICHIHTCYLEQCRKHLETAIKNRCAKQNSDLQTDLLWLAINAIKYNIEFGYLNEAQSILEDVVGCNNLCNNQKETNYGCSCCR